MLRVGCAWYCALLLWSSGTQHVANKYLFFGTILDYQLVPMQFAVLTAAVLPWLHLMLAAILIAPGVSRTTPFAATALLGLVFVGAQLTVIIRGLPVDCGCFGAMTERPVGVTSLSIAGSLLMAGLVGAMLTRRTVGKSKVATAEVATPRSEGVLQRTGNVSLSVIIPVYNEASTVEQVVAEVDRVAHQRGWDCEILVVDDGSTDGTGERLAKYAERSGIQVLSHETNRGKGRAIRTGLAAATRDLTVIQDADLEYEPGQISALVAAMREHKADVVYGSRVLGAKAGMTKQRWNVYAAGVCVLNLAVRLLYGLRVTDEATCYKLFRTADLRRMDLACERFEFCPEVTAKAARLGLSVVEVPISYTPRTTREGKKIGFRDGLCAFQTLWQHQRWAPRMATD